jgi:intracellular sulfur oxidation DsrE/DsrF family protein
MKSDFVRYFFALMMATGLLSVVHAAEEEMSALEKGASQFQIQTPPGYVFGVTVRTAQQLDAVLDRADSLRKLFNPEQHSRISIVLHGDELKLFQKANYSANQSSVDRARLLDQAQIIDIKACQTMMRTLDIQQSELPGFIEQVPLGPAEIDRLNKDLGFTRF